MLKKRGDGTTELGASLFGAVNGNRKGKLGLRMGVYVKDPNAKNATNVNPYVVLARRAAMVFTYHGTYTVDELSITVTHHSGVR